MSAVRALTAAALAAGGLGTAATTAAAADPEYTCTGIQRPDAWTATYLCTGEVSDRFRYRLCAEDDEGNRKCGEWTPWNRTIFVQLDRPIATAWVQAIA